MSNDNKLTIPFFDIDGTICDVGDRFINNPLPEELEKNRKDPRYQQWLLSIQTPELLAKDRPVRGTQHLVGAFERSVYLTSRSELHKEDTIKWLATHNFPTRHLIMRNALDTRSYAEFKENAIKDHIWRIAEAENSCPEAYNVVVFDDDDKGKLEEVCHKNGWSMFKARSGGKVI